jgi:carboxyl-terminal processing protease
VRRTLLLLLVVLLPVRGMAEPFSGRSLNQPLVAAMMTTALEALEPRILEPVPMPRLALWALGGLASLDARLQPDLQDGTLRLVAPGLVLFARVPPAPDDAAGWGEAIAQMVRAAWDGSEAVREAGTQRVIAALLDELTSHLDPYSRYAPPAEAEAERARPPGRARRQCRRAGWRCGARD